MSVSVTLAVAVILLPCLYTVSLGFFDDVFIPHQSLQHPKRLYPTTCSKGHPLLLVMVISKSFSPSLPTFFLLGGKQLGGWGGGGRGLVRQRVRQRE